MFISFKKIPIKQALLALIPLLTAYTSSAQLTVNGAPTPVQLVQNVLLGSGVTASNITYTGSINCRGSFNGTASNIGFNAGVLLTCGNLVNAIGPNNTSSASVDNSLPGDPDLDAIMSPSLSYDATILEFDFIPTSDTVKFRYVFGSEEYMEYVSTFPGGINDGFGFFISGPGISGPFSNNSQNIALIPGTTLPVTMFNLNLNSNSAFYFDNGDGLGSGTAPDGATIQYDGFTVPLTAVAFVQCGQTYHIKLAVGDGGDHILDSGVFLEAGSFSSHSVSIIPHISYGGPNDSTLYEGCGAACIYFVRAANLPNADTVSLTIAGTALNGTDYYDNNIGPGTPLPNQIIFAPGQDSVSFCINAVADGSLEGLESITLTIPPHSSGSCIQATASATIYLNEFTPLTLTTNNDTSLCNILGPVTLLANVTGGVQPYTYSWTNGAASTANPTVNPSTTTIYHVTVNDACSGTPDPTPAVTDSVVVTLVTIPVITSNISYGGTNNFTFYEGCGQACIYFVRSLGIAQSATFTLTTSGTATNGTDFSPALPTQLVFPAGQDSLTYCINATADGTSEGIETLLLSITVPGVCNLTANHTLNIAEATPLTITTTNDTVLNCTTGPVNLFVIATGGVQPYLYSWSNGAGSVTSQTITPSASTTYTVTVSDACNGTPDPTPTITDSIKVTLNIPLPLTVTAGNDITICPDNIVNLTATTSGGAVPLTYLWTSNGADSVNLANMANATVFATTTAVYTITLHDFCGNTQNDQVTVNVEENCLLNIPNVISSEGQGDPLNDLFFIENLERFPATSLIIYNRWGNKIYETANYPNNWNGSKYSAGTYYYILTIPTSSGQVAAKVKPTTGTLSFKETKIDNGTVFTGFFLIVKSK